MKNKQKINRRNILKLGLIGGLAAIVGCSEPEIKTVRYPVEDLLSNYNGWSIYFTDENTKEIVEKRFYNTGDGVCRVSVYRDLEDSQERYAYVLTKHPEFLEPNSDRNQSYDATIHIRKSDRIQGGFDCTGGKFPKYTKRGTFE